MTSIKCSYIKSNIIMRRLPAVMATLILLAGCESDKKTDDVDAYFKDNPYTSQPRHDPAEKALSLSPGTAEASRIGQKLHFKVSGGAAPYRWSVAHSSRGSLHVDGSSEAVYTVLRVDFNDVIVSDGRGHAAVARITAPVSELHVTVEPAILENDGDVAIVTAAGGVAPYTWTVEYPSRGNLLAVSGSSVSYVRNAAGDNVIILNDAANNSVNTLVSQP